MAPVSSKEKHVVYPGGHTYYFVWRVTQKIANPARKGRPITANAPTAQHHRASKQSLLATFGLLIAVSGGTISDKRRVERQLRNGEQSQDKKTHILKATTKILNEKGLQGLSFESVANEAGLSRQLIRYYFADLDTLVSELCDYLGNVYRDILVAGIVEVGQVERLRFFLDFLFDLTENYRMPANLEAYDAMVAYAVGSNQVKERLSGQYKTLGQVIAQELAIAHPELDGPSCDELSFLFVSMMHAHWSFVASLGFSRQHSQAMRNAIDRLIASYANDAPQTPRINGPWSQKN